VVRIVTSSACHRGARRGCNAVSRWSWTATIAGDTAGACGDRFVDRDGLLPHAGQAECSSAAVPQSRQGKVFVTRNEVISQALMKVR
jgi:hypothetical protein